jgi:ribosomal protein S18 acetylase RimI-like enzyme
MTSGPFAAAADLALDGERGSAQLRPLGPEVCGSLAREIVAMPPWSVMGYPAAAMTRFLSSADGGARRYLIAVGGKAAGAASIRYPWLRGPYLELLALLPEFQNRGIGAALLAWFEREALRDEARNLWVCASRLNARGLRFYRRHGFKEAATLHDLLADGFDEILLRKFLPGPRN